RRDRPRDPAPGEAARAPRRALRHPVHGTERDGVGQAAEDDPPSPPRHTDLPRRHRPQERRAGGRDRRRLAADLLQPDALAARARSGKRGAAAGAVPDDLVDGVGLCGPRERIAELVERWKDTPVTTMIIATMQREAMELMASLVL